MALIKCYECNKEMSDTIDHCPHCGASQSLKDWVPWKEKTLGDKVWIIFCISAILVPLWLLLREFFGQLLN
jgi:hypothetical protein